MPENLASCQRMVCQELFKSLELFFFWFKALYSFQVRKNPNVITILNLRDVAFSKSEDAKKIVDQKNPRRTRVYSFLGNWCALKGALIFFLLLNSVFSIEHCSGGNNVFLITPRTDYNRSYWLSLLQGLNNFWISVMGKLFTVQASPTKQ